jgi:hypothetical protein
MITGSASATAFIIEGGNACIPVGSQTDLTILLSDVPKGLSGLNISVSVSDPATIAVTNISYPEWAMLHTKIGHSDSVVGLKMVDLQQKINAGVSNVIISRLTVSAYEEGVGILTVTPVLIEDDVGGIYSTAPVKKSICLENTGQAVQPPFPVEPDTSVPVQSPSLIPRLDQTPARITKASPVSTNPDAVSADITALQTIAVADDHAESVSQDMPRSVQNSENGSQPSVTGPVSTPGFGILSCLTVVALAGLFFRNGGVK